MTRVLERLEALFEAHGDGRYLESITEHMLQSAHFATLAAAGRALPCVSPPRRPPTRKEARVKEAEHV
jgi:predicted HD phosphohydrolase